MGNASNRDQWAVRQRLQYIERCAWWRGVVNRQDLAEYFGLSMAQVSSDLQAYQELNADALVYNLRRKRYEGVAEMRCVMHEPRLEEALGWLRGGAGLTLPLVAGESAGLLPEAQVAMLALPAREVLPTVSRRIFLAALRGERLDIRYASVHGAQEGWRGVRPHAFGHDGHRWHARAWCEKNRDYRDFSLSRVREAKWPQAPDTESRNGGEGGVGADAAARAGAGGTGIPVDAAWHEFVTLRLRPHRSLIGEKRRAVELDFAMRAGECRMTVRRAMENYLRARLLLPLREGGKPQPLLEEAEAGP